MADIYTYTDYRVFIKDHSVDLKKEDKSFSQRYLLKQMKISEEQISLTGFSPHLSLYSDAFYLDLILTNLLKMLKINA